MKWTDNPAMVNELRIENALRPEHLVKLPRNQWTPIKVKLPDKLKEVWRSRYFLVQIFQEKNGIERLSVCISDVDSTTGRWKDGLSWEQLQDIKRQVGRNDKDAVEIFPADSDIVNVANMRHLWILPDQLPFAWRAKKIEQPSYSAKSAQNNMGDAI